LATRANTPPPPLSPPAPITVARDVTIPAGSSGRVALGAAASGPSSFTGSVVIGSAGSNAPKTVELFAADGAAVSFSAGIHTAGGYEGHVALDKTGPGLAILESLNALDGVVNVADGTLQIDGTLIARQVFVEPAGTLAGSGVIAAPTVVIGGVLAPGGSPILHALAGDGGSSWMPDSGTGMEPTGVTLGAANPAPVPEPGAWAMLAVLGGVLGLAAARKAAGKSPPAERRRRG
jgi:hypothetical protein